MPQDGSGQPGLVLRPTSAQKNIVANELYSARPKLTLTRSVNEDATRILVYTSG